MKKLLTLTILLMTTTNTVFAQEELFEAREYQNEDGNLLNYRLLIPEGYNPDESYPLILFLHGAGERGNDNEAQLKWGVTRFAEEEMMERNPAIVIAPQVTEDQFWVHLPIWNFHGALDQVVPADLSRSMIQAIRAAGGTPGYTEYPHIGHDSWIPAYNDDYVLEWLFAQNRKKD